MPDTIIPITNLAEVGVVKDYPAIGLPPNAFTDSLNVRFRHGSVSKMEGERPVLLMTPTQFGYPNGEYVYIAEWANPNLGDNNSYYVLIIQDAGTEYIILVRAVAEDLDSPAHTLIGTVSTNPLAKWQHTLFQGGFGFVLNDGLNKPLYLLDTNDGLDFASFQLYELPGWDSYQTFELVLEVEVNDAINTPDYSLGRLIDFTLNELVIEAYNSVGAKQWDTVATGNGNVSASGATAAVVSTDSGSNSTKVAPFYSGQNGLADGYTLKVYERSASTVDVRASIIKGFGDFLVAGGLRIIDPVDDSLVRQLPGMIRTSSIAGPGAMPTSWNPYEVGSNTADEIQLASTGIVKDMVPLQNQLMIYTTTSIHALTVTNNPSIPFTVTNIAAGYGAMALDSVLEFEGKHLVIGNNDIYVFGGHPGSIQSVAEGKIRDFFYEDLNIDFIRNIIMIRNANKDEIWICYPSGNAEYPDKTLIWNFRSNCWYIRQMSEMRSGFSGRGGLIDYYQGGDADTGPGNLEVPIDDFDDELVGGGAAQVAIETVDADDASPDEFNPAKRYPVFCDATQVYLCEAKNVYTTYNYETYESKVCRKEMPMTPEFTVESMSSLALWTSRALENNIDLSVYIMTHNNPTGDEFTVGDADARTFTIGTDYKVDIRKTGRFFDYIISDKPLSSSVGTADGWSLSGMQANIKGKGAR